MKLIRVFTACFILLFSIRGARAAGPTYIHYNITQSTEWSLANSPYVIQQDITVLAGATLTVDPGVEVRFNSLPAAKAGTGPNLLIQGALRAVANHKAPISFISAVQGEQWGAIHFLYCDSGHCVLQQCEIRGGLIICTGSSPAITSCSISRCKRGIEVSDDSQPHIVGNWIKGNRYGLLLTADTASPVVERNVITGNNYGIYLKAFGSPTITQNQIYGNLQYNLVNASAKNLDIPGNNFNRADAAQVGRGIYDGANHPGRGRLNYMPFTVTAAPPLAGAPASAPAQEARTHEQFSFSLDALYQALIISPWILSPYSGVGGQVFLDWRPSPYLSLGAGAQYAYFLGTPTFKLGSFDLGGRIFPFPLGVNPTGEFYLQGGVGLNLLVLPPAEGHFHGYAGPGYRLFLDKTLALDMGLQYDFYSPIGDPSHGVSVKFGLTFLR